MSKTGKIIARIIALVLAVAIRIGVWANFMLISRREAVGIALKNASLSETEVVGLSAKLDFDDGLIKYEVQFYCDGVEYEYTLNARDGYVLKEEIEGAGYTPTGGRPGNGYEEQSSPSDSSIPTGAEEVSRESAEKLALEDAGFTSEEVTGLRTTVDNDDNAFEVEFFTEEAEYDYKIGIFSPARVIEKSIDFFFARRNTATGEEEITPLDSGLAKQAVLAHIGVSEKQANRVRAVAETEDGVRVFDVTVVTDEAIYEYEVRASDGRILDIDIKYNR